ncbi:MAG: hyalin [Isosphaeraceae bacterium]|nr:MAG: hyalin [Isosphaeraceae bacterium]
MDLATLRSFLKIVEHGTFTRAAVACGVSQPALSQQVAKLEAELGTPLFERQGRRLKLTETGERLRERAEQIVALVDDTARELADDGRTGRLAVAAIPTIAPYFLPGPLKAFREQHPEVRLELHELTTEALLKALRQGDVDLGVLALPVDGRYLEFEPLFEESLLLVVPAGHRLARGGPVRLDRLRAEPFVLLDEAHCLSGQIRSFCERRQFHPLETGRSTQLATVQEMVALGHGLSFVPEMARRLDTSDQRVYVPIAGEAPRRTIGVGWNPYRYQSRLARAFREQLRSAARPDEPSRSR